MERFSVPISNRDGHRMAGTGTRVVYMEKLPDCGYDRNNNHHRIVAKRNHA